MTATEKIHEIEGILMLFTHTDQAILEAWGDQETMADNIPAMRELAAEGALQEIYRVLLRKPGEE